MSERAAADDATLAFSRRKQPLATGFLPAEDVAQAALYLLSRRVALRHRPDHHGRWRLVRHRRQLTSRLPSRPYAIAPSRPTNPSPRGPGGRRCPLPYQPSRPHHLGLRLARATRLAGAGGRGSRARRAGAGRHPRGPGRRRGHGPARPGGRRHRRRVRRRDAPRGLLHGRVLPPPDRRGAAAPRRRLGPGRPRPAAPLPVAGAHRRAGRPGRRGGVRVRPTAHDAADQGRRCRAPSRCRAA